MEKIVFPRGTALSPEGHDCNLTVSSDATTFHRPIWSRVFMTVPLRSERAACLVPSSATKQCSESNKSSLGTCLGQIRPILLLICDKLKCHNDNSGVYMSLLDIGITLTGLVNFVFTI